MPIKVAKVSVTVPKAAKGQKRGSKVQRAIDYVRGILLGVATNIYFPLLNAPTPPSNAAAKANTEPPTLDETPPSNAVEKAHIVSRLAKANIAALALDEKRALVAEYLEYTRSDEFRQMRANLKATATPPTYDQIQAANNAVQAQQDIVKAGSTKADTSVLKELYKVLFAPVTGLMILAGNYVQAQGGTNLAILQSSNYAITQTVVTPINELAQPGTPKLEPPMVKVGGTITFVSGSLEARLPEGVENANRYVYQLVQTANMVPVPNGLVISAEENQIKYIFDTIPADADFIPEGMKAGDPLPSGVQFMVTVIAKARRKGVVSTESNPAYSYVL